MKSSHSPPRFSRFIWIFLFLGVLAVLAIAYFQVRKLRTSPKISLDHYGRVPEFRLTNQDGKEMSLSDFRGTIWVVDFIFTRCQGPCPVLSLRLSQLQNALGGSKDVKLVSVTVDPQYDVPQVLTEYAKKFRADTKQWIFLTGGTDQIEAFMVRGLLQPVIRNPSAGLIHSTQIVLIDSDGQIRAFRDGTDPQVVAQLVSDIQSLRYEVSHR